MKTTTTQITPLRTTPRMSSPLANSHVPHPYVISSAFKPPLTPSCQAVVSFSVVKSEDNGRKGKGNSRPGLRDLPPEIGPNVKDTMKPELIRWIATSKTPWDSPSLDVFQQAYDRFFPNYPAMLELKDPLCSSVRRKCLPIAKH
jgi:hypothetical protein